MNRILQKWRRSFVKFSSSPFLYFRKKFYKVMYRSHLCQCIMKDYIDSSFLFVRTLNRSKERPITNFLHSGILGDLIYSLPTCKTLAKGEKCTIYLNFPKQKNVFSKKAEDNIADFRPYFLLVYKQLKPLFDYQKDLTLLEYTHEDYDKCFDLDIWRDVKRTIKMPSYDMAKRYQWVCAVQIDLWKPWLTAPKNEKYKNAIVCTRNARWSNDKISYRFLENYPEVYFIGFEHEYKEFGTPSMKYLPINNFLEAATIINSCKVFVSSQTFFFSLAEALKSPRVLEVCFKTPDIRCNGGVCCECIYQDCLESAVRKIYEGTF